MYGDGAIVISLEEEKDEETKEVLKSYFQGEANVKYFDNEKQAKAFIDAVCATPLTKTLEIISVIDHNSNLKNFDDALVYETQISYLEAQYDLVFGGYSQLIDNYGDVLLEDGRHISEYRNDMRNYFQNYSLASLYTEIRHKGLVKNYSDYQSRLELNLTSLEKNLL